MDGPPGDEIKVCPDCAETVKAEAVCRFCGYRFDPDATADASAAAPVARRKRSGAAVLRRLIVLMGVIVIGFLVWKHFHGGIRTKPYAVCTVSSSQNDVNLVITGNGAESFCTKQAATLSGSGDFYVVAQAAISSLRTTDPPASPPSATSPAARSTSRCWTTAAKPSALTTAASSKRTAGRSTARNGLHRAATAAGW